MNSGLNGCVQMKGFGHMMKPQRVISDSAAMYPQLLSVSAQCFGLTAYNLQKIWFILPAFININSNSDRQLFLAKDSLDTCPALDSRQTKLRPVNFFHVHVSAKVSVR